VDDPRTLAAVITAAVAVVVVVIGQVSTWTLEHRNRVYERRRAALIDVQNAALGVRAALRRLAPGITTAAETAQGGTEIDVREDPELSLARGDADALLEVHLARVESSEVRRLVREWHTAARYSFLGTDDVTDRDEEVAWARMNSEIGGALAVPGWWRTRLDAVRRRRRRRAERPRA